MEIVVNLTLEQIYKVVCPECQEKLLNLAAQSANISHVKAALQKKLESKGR